MEKPKLLFLAQCLPYPVNSGVRIRTYHNLKMLAEAYDVRALCFFRRTAHPTAEKVEAACNSLSELAQTNAFPIPQEHSDLRKVWDHMRSAASGRVYTYWTHKAQAFLEKVKEEVTLHRPVAVHLDSLDLSAVLDVIPPEMPISVCHHNIESELLERRAAGAKGFMRRYLMHQAKLMRQEERALSPRMAVNFVVSDQDAALLRKRSPQSHVVVAPNGVDTGNQRPIVSSEDGLIFVGGANWLPNRDALEHFSQDILPILRSRLPTIPVHWVGQCSKEQQEIYRQEYGLNMTGFVETLVPYLQRASIFIVPMRIGGGTRLKILDAWSYGLPVVSTSQGAEGLATSHRRNILIANDPASFVDAIVELHTNKQLRTDIGLGGRRTAEQMYDWSRIGELMRSALPISAVQVAPSTSTE